MANNANIPNKSNPHNPRKEVALLKLGEAISSYIPNRDHDPAPYCRNDDSKNYGEMLRDN
jgi:hypothetical protein